MTDDCKHEKWIPIEINFGQVDAVLCEKCGYVARRYRVEMYKNENFPWQIYPEYNKVTGHVQFKCESCGYRWLS